MTTGLFSDWPRPWIAVGADIDLPQNRFSLNLGVVGISAGRVRAPYSRGWYWVMLRWTFGWWSWDFHYGDWTEDDQEGGDHD